MVAAASVLAEAEKLGSTSTAAAATSAPVAAAAAPNAAAASSAAPADSETATGSAAAGAAPGAAAGVAAAAGAQEVQDDARACRLLSLTCEEAAEDGLEAGGGGGTLQLVLELTGIAMYCSPNPYSRPNLHPTPLPPPHPKFHTSPYGSCAIPLLALALEQACVRWPKSS